MAASDEPNMDPALPSLATVNAGIGFGCEQLRLEMKWVARFLWHSSVVSPVAAEPRGGASGTHASAPTRCNRRRAR
eukprot:scaffold141633_cov31-Tisochrysis_lutea.AAC.6